jgi:hypothetical protein
VFRRATPTGTILSTNFQQLHWHSEDPVVSPLHPDIINDAFIVEVIRKCGWDTRCGFLDGFLYDKSVILIHFRLNILVETIHSIV